MNNVGSSPSVSLATEPSVNPLQARVVEVNGCCKPEINGECFEPLAFRSFRPERRNIREFADAGVRLMSILTTGQNCTLDVPYSPFGEIWLGPGLYDFSRFDRQMELFMEEAPTAYFNIMLQIDTKDWYLQARPECANTFTHLVNTVGDPQWRADTRRFLQDVIDHIESRYGHRVFAYSLLCGTCSEWFFGYPTSSEASVNLPSDSLKEAGFRQFLQSPEATLPPPDSLYETAAGIFRDPEQDAAALDYWRFHHGIIAETILYFAAEVKERVQRQKLVGVFFGYLNCFTGQCLLHMGHLDFDRVWSSPDIDMVFSPASYGPERGFEGASGHQLPVDSLSLQGKIFFQEIDHTTHIAPTHVENGRAIPGSKNRLRNEFECRMVLRREYMLSRIHNHALWWFDFFGGYYYDDALMGEVSNIVRTQERLKGIAMRSTAEVAVFSDAASMYAVNGQTNLGNDLLMQMPRELARLGAPVDFFSFADLDHSRLPLDRYKLVIFLNTFHIPPAKLDFIRERVARDGRTLLWFYAPNYVQDHGVDVAGIAAATGIAVAPRPSEESRMVIDKSGLFARLPQAQESAFTLTDYEDNRPVTPLFAVDDPAAQVWGRYADDGAPALASRDFAGHRSFYSAVGSLPAPVCREIARSAGVHLYAEGPDPLYINSRLFGIHLQGETPPLLSFPSKQPFRLVDLFDGGETLVRDGQCRLPMTPGTAKLFLVEDACVKSSNT